MLITKEQAIDAVLEHGILMFGKGTDPFFLKSGRASRLFFNAGNADHGEMVEILEEVYAELMVKDVGDKPIVCFGLPYKCINVASHAAAGLAKRGANARWNSYRKEEKDHGGDAKAMLVARGTNIQDCGGRVGLVDDVVTTGASKHEGHEVLQRLAKEDGFELDITGVYILVDRQEVTSTDTGESAVRQFENSTGLKVKAYFTASELIEAGRVRGLITDDEYRFCMTYFRVYGCPEVVEAYRDKIGPDVMTQPLFMPVRRSIIPACDFEDIVLFEALVAAVADVDGVGGFKVGSLLAERHGLEKLVGIVRNKAPNKAFIYDRQKGGTDIPDMVWKQVRQYGQIGCQAHIIFPSMTGVESMLAAIHSGYEHGVKIIMGAYMTHAGFDRAEGGCVTVEDASRLYAIAASKGIRNFVMPGTRPDLISLFRSQLKAQGAESVAVFSPGLITQQGSVSQAGQAAGENFGAIAGRAIYEKSPGAFKTPEEMRAAVLKLTAQL